MSNPYVFDKAKYHNETIEQFGLPESHAANHTVPFLRWLIENKLMSEFFVAECSEELVKFKQGQITIHELYGWWDCCLISDMISERGNAFCMTYFDFEKGSYIADYEATLKVALPSIFHIEYSDENYDRLRRVIDKRYKNWIHPAKPWWKIWH